MELTLLYDASFNRYGAGGSFELEAGKSFRIQKGPPAEDELVAAVPVGKRWKVSVHVTVEETDA
jgi:hypothetical protein